jgi:hypothetical protein
MAGWTLNVEFRDMFFLVNYPPLVAGATATPGAVVLLPHAGHSAVVWVDRPRRSYGLYRSQVNIGPAWGTATQVTPNAYLPSANAVFGSCPLDPQLIQSVPVPQSLNARVVLAGGTFTPGPCHDGHADFDWKFMTGTGQQKGPNCRLTDRLEYVVNMPDGDATLIITHEDGTNDQISIDGGTNHTLVIWNRDLNDDGTSKTLPPGHYRLDEFNGLHALFGMSGTTASTTVVPEGDYPDGLASAGGNRPVNSMPICGGEQGTPLNPPNPPAPPPLSRMMRR